MRHGPMRQADIEQSGQINIAAPAGPDLVTGRARYTMDVAVDGLLHMKILRSPHAFARIARIDAGAALTVSGVVAVLTYEDAPQRYFSDRPGVMTPLSAGPISWGSPL